ncbi:MAG: GGDEF domain-containing protein [Rhodoferax sp.]
MRLNTKATLFFATLVGLLTVALAAISLYAFRSFSMAMASDHIRTAAEIVRVHLTDAMINGNIGQRESFLNRLMEVQGLKSARVYRSPSVVQQFGPGLRQEADADAQVQAVFRQAQPQFLLDDSQDDLIFRGLIPYVASSHGTPNCLQCHQVPEGTVLGVVSMTMLISALRHQALMAVAGVVGVVALFGALLVLLMRRLLQPIASTAHAVEGAVRKALLGDFKTELAHRTHDELGNIAAELNRLLRFLDDGLNRIGHSVSRLTGRTADADENLLVSTIAMVDGLTRAAHFKQAIEEDETRLEIYQRLATLLQREHAVAQFSLYEVEPHKQQMIPILVDGQVGADCQWCDPQILVRPQACRARRTGHLVDGVTTPDICNAFKSPEAGSHRHLCFPILQSGGVGAVLQLVVPPEQGQALQSMEPYVNVYLREAAPVLETKRLMENLREATLRDPMTGLSNRRFLEEYVETLVASVQRKKAHLAILMLDLDYFKMVNDTYGHDAGDTVLKALAKVLKQSVRASDMVIRYGGEEFLIILQDSSGTQADQVAEKIRASVEALKVPVGSAVLQKTISIGIADFPSDSDTFWQTVKYADVALYHAKESGRNRVLRFNPSMWTDNKEY